MRDDFSQLTKEKLAHRAGYRCSKPDCGVLTRGAASDHEKTINLGEAAHITAASAGGPRYDPTLSREQRKHHLNGLWLCATHAKLVDSDEGRFTGDQLREWKRQAEKRSFDEVVSGSSRTPTPVASDEQAVLKRLIDAARTDLAGFQRTLEWPSHPIALNLQIKDANGSRTFDVNGLATAVEAFDELVVVAPPGTGKTTTLLQLIDSMLAQGASAAAFIPLSEWSTTRERFLPSLLRRRPFREFDAAGLELLAQQGRLTLVLDGWNELDEASRQFAATEIKSLQRDLPAMRFVISSRFEEYDLPIANRLVRVSPLTEKQQLEIARALRGKDGESVMEHAWRTPGLRELVAIPLYLSVLLKQAKGSTLPTTKEEILRTFVREHDQDPEKRRILHRELEDRHQEILTALADAAIRQQTTTLSDECARRVVGQVRDQLKADRQISKEISPMRVLEVLVSTHLIVRSGEERGTISFQHHQFQEWYASLLVERLMQSILSGSADGMRVLRQDVLNMPAWEEAILFACDRMSRADKTGIELVASVVLEALGIDPLLSAEIIYRSASSVWDRVKDKVFAFARTWHAERKVDRAIQFMINTGRPEFSEYIWPLISDPDGQVHLSALRAGRRFRTTVLGPNVRDRILPLTEELRAHILSELARESGIDGIELATTLAKEDKSPRVRLAVIDALMFRRAERFAAEILQSSPDEVWLKAAKWGAEEFADPEISSRLEVAVQRLRTAESDPVRQLHALLDQKPRDDAIGPTVKGAIERLDFSQKDQNDSWILHKAYERFPEEVAAGLITHLEKGASIPFGSGDFLRASNICVDEGPIAERLLRLSAEDRQADMAASAAGPRLVGVLIDRRIELENEIRNADREHRKEVGEEYQKLSDLISNSKASSFIQAVLERSGTENINAICVLLELLGRHGRDVERSALAIDQVAHNQITAAVQKWGKLLLAAPDVSREQFARIPRAIERLRSPSLVPLLKELLAQDLARRQKAIEERKGGRRDNDAHMVWTNWYARAFVAIADVPSIEAMKAYLANREMGVEAAHALYAIWKKAQPATDEERRMLRSWPDFSEVQEKSAATTKPITHRFIDDILAVVTELTGPDTTEEVHRHALELAAAAFGMPYANKSAAIDALLALPGPAIEKQKLLIVLALAGETIPSDIVLQGIDELFEAAKKKPWMVQDQDGWRFHDWLMLLPFTERPSAVRDVLSRKPLPHAAPWNFRQLLSALRYSASPECEQVLQELPTLDPRFVEAHDWVSALTGRNTLSAARILLDAVCGVDTLKMRDFHRRLDFGRDFAALIARHSQFRADVYERYQATPAGPISILLEHAIADAADVAGALLLVRVVASHGRQMHSSALYTALRQVLVARKPSIEMTGAEELYALPSALLRKELFNLFLNGTGAESKLAAECLIAVDEIRDDYGHLELEPRHPDIQTGAPWPQDVIVRYASSAS